MRIILILSVGFSLCACQGEVVEVFQDKPERPVSVVLTLEDGTKLTNDSPASYVIYEPGDSGSPVPSSGLHFYVSDPEGQFITVHLFDFELISGATAYEIGDPRSERGVNQIDAAFNGDVYVATTGSVRVDLSANKQLSGDLTSETVSTSSEDTGPSLRGVFEGAWTLQCNRFEPVDGEPQWLADPHFDSLFCAQQYGALGDGTF